MNTCEKYLGFKKYKITFLLIETSPTKRVNKDINVKGLMSGNSCLA